MESSALLYVALVLVTVGLALLIHNREYVAGRLSGRREAGRNREQGYNLVLEGAIYVLLAGVSAFRIAIGRDYWVYTANFELISLGRHVSYEPGFQLVVRFMQLIFGDSTYKPIFFLFSVLTVYFFVKAIHDQGKWYALSLYLLMTGGYYFSSMHNVRYYFALAIALYSVKYVFRGEYGKFFLWIVAAAGFHKSVLVVIPIYLIAKWLSGICLKTWHFVLGGLLVASLVFGQELYREMIFFFYPYYRGSMFDTGQISWVNVGKCLGTLVICLSAWKEGLSESREDKFYFYLNLAGLAVYTLGSFIPEVSRIAYYMTLFQIFLIPHALQYMKKGVWRTLCTIGVIGAFALYFVIYLYQAYDKGMGLLPYLNWIFQ